MRREVNRSYGWLVLTKKAETLTCPPKADPYHPSLQFKRVHTYDPIVSVRIALGWRAVGIREQKTVVWFWIGTHSEYDKVISNL